jgi:poly-gamma-glutamate capsule biosynthesis protein CapA/YwtB (metallophosphatase superfamily)
MFRKINSLVLIIVNSFWLSAQNANLSNEKISLLFMGDIMGHDEQIWSAENRETHTYSYDDVFQYVKDEISEADIAIANFEVTLAGSPYSGYPTFSSPAPLAAACINAGIDVFATANNHAADRGNKGILSTIYRLDSLGIPHTGTFSDPAARDTLYPMIIEKNGFSLALLNYTYATNGITVPPPVIVNMLERNTVTTDIEKAKSKNPDAIILFLHWGTEYDTVPSKTQTDMAEYFFSRGVDLIIGSHPHVLQRMEWTKSETGMKDWIVVYSMGNYVSNQRRTRTDGGTMVRIELTKEADSLYVSDAGYYLTWVYTPIENYRKKFFVLPCSKFENKPEFFAKPADYQKMKLFIKNSRSLLYGQNIKINELIYSDNSWLY